MANILSNIPGLSNSISVQMSASYNLIPDSKASTTIVPGSKGELLTKPNGDPSRSFFSIQYYDPSGEPKYFNFSLLPSINPGLQGFSGMSVPGSGPGIKIKSKMRQRSITIPGSSPVIQTIGIESTIIELVGIFTGFEKSFSTSKAYLNDERGYLASSGDVASVFRYEVVEPSTPVQLSIKASSGYVNDNTGAFVSDPNEKAISIETKILISDFEQMVRQYDRTYFYIKAFVLTYPNTKRKNPKDPNAPKPAAAKPLPIPKTITQVTLPPAPTPPRNTTPNPLDPNGTINNSVRVNTPLTNVSDVINNPIPNRPVNPSLPNNPLTPSNPVNISPINPLTPTSDVINRPSINPSNPLTPNNLNFEPVNLYTPLTPINNTTNQFQPVVQPPFPPVRGPFR